jgi:magnesium-transporting ATPase (P-type)
MPTPHTRFAFLLQRGRAVLKLPLPQYWQVYATGSETFFGRTAMLINAVNDPGNFEKRLRQITLAITCSGVVLVVITFLYLVANRQPVCSHSC